MNRSFHKKHSLAAVLFVVALSLPFAAMARPPGGHRGLEMQIEQLGLDAASQAEVDAVLDASREQRRALERDIRAAREQMHELLATGDSDEASLLAQADVISSLELARHKQRIANHLQLRALLSAEQMESLASAGRPAHPGRGSRH